MSNRMLGGIGADVRLSVRSLRAAPALTIAAVLTLALGIGATTAIFTVANGLILRPLPVTDPQRLVTITSDTALRFGFQAGAGWSYAMWDRLRQRADAFDGAFAWTLQRLDLSEGGESQAIETLFASGDFFSTLGVRAGIGRTFTAADDVRGGGPDGAVMVISHDFWRRRFDGRVGVVGTRLSVEGTQVTVVGVAPQGFRGVDVGRPFDVAIPFGTEALIRGRRSLVESERALLLTVMLRLKAGQTVSQATAALRAMQPQIVGERVPPFLTEPVFAVPASTGISDRSGLRQRYERPVVILAIVSGLVLTIVCVNIASLSLARASARRRDLSIRVAIGAPRRRLARQPFVEGLLLGGTGAIAGVVFATWASRLFAVQLPSAGGSAHLDLPLDWRVLAFAMGLATLAVVSFAALPALYAAHVRPLEALQEEGRGSGGGGTGLLSGGLIAAQIAISLVLLSAAGLFTRTLNRLSNVPLGFDPHGMLVVAVSPAGAPADRTARVQWYERIQESIAAVPGVSLAAGSLWIPVGSGAGGVLSGAGGRRADVGSRVAYNFVTPGWFATYRTEMRTGRDFDGRDRPGAPRVVIVNETMRRNLLREGKLSGDTLVADPDGPPARTVVGVAADAVYGRSLRDAPPPTIYTPIAQAEDLRPDATFHVSVRTSGDVAQVTSGLAAALARVDPRLVYTFRSLDADVDAAVAQERLVARLAGLFGGIALLLSAIGLYGVTAYSVNRRRGEIGIRLALGGQAPAVLRVILGRIAVFALAGTAAGLLLAVWLSRFTAPLLYGLAPRDPATLVTATATLVLVASVAAWIPASRAVRVDPASVLREQ